MHHFNELTPPEAERLAMLAEECGEVVQAVSKVLRHGYRSFHPDRSGCDNRGDLEREIGDLFAIIGTMIAKGDISGGACDAWEDRKLERLHEYTHHQ